MNVDLQFENEPFSEIKYIFLIIGDNKFLIEQICDEDIYYKLLGYLENKNELYVIVWKYKHNDVWIGRHNHNIWLFIIKNDEIEKIKLKIDDVCKLDYNETNIEIFNDKLLIGLKHENWYYNIVDINKRKVKRITGNFNNKHFYGKNNFDNKYKDNNFLILSEFDTYLDNDGSTIYHIVDINGLSDITIKTKDYIKNIKRIGDYLIVLIGKELHIVGNKKYKDITVGKFPDKIEIEDDVIKLTIDNEERLYHFSFLKTILHKLKINNGDR